MKTMITAAMSLLFFTSTAAFAEIPSCAKASGYKATYCEEPQKATTPKKKKAQKRRAPRLPIYYGVPPPPPQPLLEENPLMIIPNFFGRILSNTQDVLEGGVNTVKTGVTNVIEAPGKALNGATSRW